MAHGYSGSNRAGSNQGGAADALARGLGWFSIALGITELLGARSLTRTLGMEGRENLVRAYGLREIGTGVSILASRDPTPWIWARVAGDALDLATLAPALDRRNPERGNAGLAVGMVAGVTLLDLICAQALQSGRGQPRRIYDYSDRSGLPRPPHEMRGAARDVRLAAHIDESLMEHPRGGTGGRTGDPGRGTSEGGLNAVDSQEVAEGHPS